MFYDSYLCVCDVIVAHLPRAVSLLRGEQHILLVSASAAAIIRANLRVAFAGDDLRAVACIALKDHGVALHAGDWYGEGARLHIRHAQLVERTGESRGGGECRECGYDGEFCDEFHICIVCFAGFEIPRSYSHTAGCKIPRFILIRQAICTVSRCRLLEWWSPAVHKLPALRNQPGRCGARWMLICLVSRYSSSPHVPSSRPQPLCL